MIASPPEHVLIAEVRQVHAALIREWESRGHGRTAMDRVSVIATAARLAATLFPQYSPDALHDIGKRVADRVLGLGPLQAFLDDPDVTEIMVNGIEATFVERNGKIERVPVQFTSPDEILAIMNHIVGTVGRRIDESSPYVDARLPDGSRVNAIIPPLALHGPTLTIRRFPAIPYTMERLLERDTLTSKMRAFLQAAVRAKRNILISGGTGSGKTSTLNALGGCIPSEERIITIEDAAEMRLTHAHVVALESRPPNIEGHGEIPIRLLVKNALRMRPDRIIVGETRGGEALDMLQAMNTGHQGSMTTVHANAAEEALLRLETMVLMADVDLPLTAVRAQISSAIHLIVQQERIVDGSRKIVSIHEVMKEPDGKSSLMLLYRYDKDRRSFVATGQIPPSIVQFAYYGVEPDLDWFLN